jgi:hypothetical protein
MDDIDLQILQKAVMDNADKMIELAETYRSEMLAEIKTARENLLLDAIRKVNTRLDAIEKKMEDPDAE